MGYNLIASKILQTIP